MSWWVVSVVVTASISVLASWIGARFTSGNLNPDDVDVTWIVDGRLYG
jgi:membrane protein implicated in regulation of membrane protease activity